MITVVKRDPQGNEMIHYEGEIQEQSPSSIVIQARWTLPTKELSYARFETDDIFTEYYYTDRWFNIFAISSPDGTFKGWYCNIAEPARILHKHIEQIDLLLDVWVDPLGTPLVLDEDEFAAATLSTHQRQGAHQGLKALLHLLTMRQEPFHMLAAR